MDAQTLALLKIGLGFVLLAAGAEFLIRGAEEVSRRLKISALFVGIFLVSLGTAAPELIVMTFSVQQRVPDIGVGSIIGSNISNILLVMALGALISPMTVRNITVFRDCVVLVAAIGLTMWASDVHLLTMRDGWFFIGALVLYLFYSFVTETRGDGLESFAPDEEDSTHNPLVGIFIIVVGVIGGGALLYFGAREIINGAVYIGNTFGLDKKVVALTIVAIGSSLPELAAAVVSAYKKRTELIVGNLLGSSVINIFGVLGLSAVLSGKMGISFAPGTVGGIPINSFYSVDLMVMLLATLLLVPFMLTGRQISRYEATALLGLYIGYIFFVFNYHDKFTSFKLPI